jgi:hypothetical protein
MNSISQSVADEFRELDVASVNYWYSSELAAIFQRLLRTSSTVALNSYDKYGWNILAYVLFCLHGAEPEIETLQTLLGPEVAMEDHSRLRIDSIIFTQRSYADTFAVVSVLFASKNPNLVQKRSIREILQLRAESKLVGSTPFPGMFFNSHIATAEHLLRNATERIQTYPKRLMQAVTDTCTDYFPTIALYTIICSYLCH